jgi:hypothetical protein
MNDEVKNKELSVTTDRFSLRPSENNKAKTTRIHHAV